MSDNVNEQESIIEAQALARLAKDEEFGNNNDTGVYIDPMIAMRNEFMKSELSKLEDSLDKHLGQDDTLDAEEDVASLLGVPEDTNDEEVVEDKPLEATNNIPQESEEVRQLKAEKEEITRLKAEALEARRQADSDKDLLIKAYQAMIENNKPKEAVKPVVPEVDEEAESIKRRSKSIFDKFISADESAVEELAQMLNETNSKAKNNKANPSIDAENLARAVEQEINKREIVKYNDKYQKVHDNFFNSNKDFVSNPVNFKLYKANFESLQNDFISKGVRPDPEALFTRALDETNREIETLTGRKMGQKSNEVNISEDLQEEAKRTEEAKLKSPKNQTATNPAKPGSAKFDQDKAYKDFLRSQGITKF